MIKHYTFHYKTIKLEKDELFCKINFGPIKSGICYCRNYQVIMDEKMFKLSHMYLMQQRLGGEPLINAEVKISTILICLEGILGLYVPIVGTP